jgi:pimeloyl-ACP methyl ester carboxylesterase
MPRKPVIFIPGFPASELREKNSGKTVFPPALGTLIDPARKAALIQSLITVPGTLKAGPPIRDILGIAKQAQALYDILAGKFGYDTSDLSDEFAAIGWDWRLGIGDATVVNSIADAVGRLSAGGGKLVAIIHSTGGLVFRAFLAARPDLLGRFEQVMAFGVPWCGALEALYSITKGESIGFLFAKITPQEGATILGHAQAAYDLLPTDPSTGLFSASGVSTTPLDDQSWIPADPGHDYMRSLATNAHGAFARNFNDLPVTNVCGWGAPTWPACTLVGGKLTFLPPDKDFGDGTVPVVSSSWIRGTKVRTMFLPIGAYATANIPHAHARIWDSPPVLQLFEEVLNDAARAPFLCAAADGNHYIDYNADVDVRISAAAPGGGALPGCKVRVDVDGTDVPINPEGRGAFILKRAGIHHNVGNDIYRFTVTFRWSGGGRVSRAVLIKSP